MAKHPVPKYKTPKSKTKSRYASFARKKIKKLEGIVFGSKHKLKKAEKVVKEQLQKKEVEKVTKIKA